MGGSSRALGVVGLSGSLRQGSFNAALLRAAQDAAPECVQLDIETIRGIPLYDGDVEASGIPDVVKALKDRIAASDGLLLVTPDHNNSIPGVFKNAIDWLTRPGTDIPRVFGNRPVALMGATPGLGGTLLAQAVSRHLFEADAILDRRRASVDAGRDDPRIEPAVHRRHRRQRALRARAFTRCAAGASD